MNGKAKCRILKEIRREIARNNDIELVTEECRYQGECKGTCPKCEAEVRYLEKELEKRRAAGKSVLVAGLAASLMITATGCSAIRELFHTEAPALQGDVPYYAGEDAMGEVPDEVVEENENDAASCEADS